MAIKTKLGERKTGFGEEVKTSKEGAGIPNRVLRAASASDEMLNTRTRGISAKGPTAIPEQKKQSVTEGSSLLGKQAAAMAFKERLTTGIEESVKKKADTGDHEASPLQGKKGTQDTTYKAATTGNGKPMYNKKF